MGAAWAAPVIALGAAAPAQAVTPGACDPATGTVKLLWDIFSAPTQSPTPESTIALSVDAQASDAQQGSNPTALSGRLINRTQITAIPLSLIYCTNPDLALTVSTERFGNAFDSYTCVPGATYPAGSQCAQAPAAPMDLTKSQWRDGANLSAVSGYDTPGQLPAPGVAGTQYGLVLGWNNYAPGGTGSFSGTAGTGSVGWQNRSVWTFTFNQPVVNLYFNLYDFDWRNNNSAGGATNSGVREYAYFDNSATMPTSFSQGGSVNGAGTAASPWWPATTTEASRNASAAGISSIYFPSVTTFKIVAWSEDTTYRTSENLFISDMTFKCPTGC